MLDECKGERLEEVMVGLSTVVLQKRLATTNTSRRSVVGDLAIAQTLSHKDKDTLIPLAIAHRRAMSALLRRKEEERQSWRHFRAVMVEHEQDLSEREAAFRAANASEETSKPKRKHLDPRETLVEHWQGEHSWLKVITEGEQPPDTDILSQSFEHVRGHVHLDRQPDNHMVPHNSLLEQLEERVSVQQNRLQKWKDYHVQFTSPTKTPRVPKTWGSPWKTPGKANGLTPGAIGFGGGGGFTSTPLMTKKYQDFFPTLEDEDQRVDESGSLSATALEGRLGADTLPIPNSRNKLIPRHIEDQDADHEEPLPTLARDSRISNSSDPVISRPQQSCPGSFLGHASPCPEKAPQTSIREIARTPSPSSEGTSDLENWSDPEPTPQHLFIPSTKFNIPSHQVDSPADNEGRSTIDSLPEISKLSLLERTRQSIALSTNNHNSDAFLPDSSPTPAPWPVDYPIEPLSLSVADNLYRRTSLLDRTRQSISSVPTQSHRRTRSSLLPGEKPINRTNHQLETPRKIPSPDKLSALVEEKALDVYSPDADYASVFKSRPRVQMSPVGTPTE